MNRSGSSLKTSELLKKFYVTVPFRSRALTGFHDDESTLPTQEANYIICATISDPRGVVNCVNVLMPRSDLLLPNLFIQLESKLGDKVNILRLINELISIATLNKNVLKEEMLDQEFEDNSHYAHPDIEEKEVAPAQQVRFKLAADLYLNGCFNILEEINPLQIFENTIGLLGKHPSVCFLVGLLCYKSGEMNHLKYAYQLFEHAKQGILLGPTCVILQSLIIFWATKCGQFEINSQNGEKDHNSEKVNKIIVNYVVDKLLQALAIADDAKNGPSSVETSLLIDMHSAISCVYFFQKWNDESLDKSKFHFEIASGLYDNISIPNDPAQNKPSILLLRAGRSLNLDVPNYMRWTQLDEMNVYLDQSWESIPNSPFRPVKKIAIFHALWPTILTDPLNAWDSGAPILAVKGSHAHFKIENVEDVQGFWWYKGSSTPSGHFVVLPKICEICGLDSSSKCKTCKKVFYCSKQCQATDWHVSHKIICKMVR